MEAGGSALEEKRDSRVASIHLDLINRNNCTRRPCRNQIWSRNQRCDSKCNGGEESEDILGANECWVHCFSLWREVPAVIIDSGSSILAVWEGISSQTGLRGGGVFFQRQY